MTRKTTVKRLERKYKQVVKGDRPIVTRYFTYKGNKPIDKDGNLLDPSKIKEIKKENEEIIKQGGTIVKLINYSRVK